MLRVWRNACSANTSRCRVAGCVGDLHPQVSAQCHKALALVPQDLFANYRLGIVFTEQYNAIGGQALLQEARQYFDAVIAINPDTDEAQRSRKYVAQIDSVLSQQAPH